MGNSLETELINRAEYASFWNYGHRIVNKKGGPTKGFVKGTYVLEKGVILCEWPHGCSFPERGGENQKGV